MTSSTVAEMWPVILLSGAGTGDDVINCCRDAASDITVKLGLAMVSSTVA